MINAATSAQVEGSIEIELREDLAQADSVIVTIAPILRHLVSSSDHSVFGDEIIARVRGMLTHVAIQLLDAVAIAVGEAERKVHPDGQIQALISGFADDPAFLSYLHALALEWQLTERLNARLAIDPVLSPLLQALVAATEAGTAGLAMALMAAQARFGQSQRRMELPLGELPGDILHSALLTLRSSTASEAGDAVRLAEQGIRAGHDEARSRLGLMARLISGLGAGGTVALALPHGGVALFLTALSLATGQDRDLVTLATNEGQVARLALALRASGMRSEGVAEQLNALHPEIEMPDGFETISVDRAAALLATSAVLPGR